RVLLPLPGPSARPAQLGGRGTSGPRLLAGVCQFGAPVMRRQLCFRCCHGRAIAGRQAKRYRAIKGGKSIMRFFACLMLIAPFVSTAASAQHEAWSTSWAASVQGPYPVGNPSALPDQRFAFPTPPIGANDQTFRLVVRPDLWGRQARLRLSNALGTKPVTFDGIFVGLQLGGAVVVPGTNQPVSFGGKDGVTIAPGEWVWSDAVALPFAADPEAPSLAGRKLAASFHIAGESEPMTWHAKALQTSYVTAPSAGARGQDEGEAAFPFSTASWFFLDAVDM